MNVNDFEFEDTPGALVIRPRADIATPEDEDMKVVLGLIRAEAEKGSKHPFDWWRWWSNVRQACRTGDVVTLESELALGLRKGFH